MPTKKSQNTMAKQGTILIVDDDLNLRKKYKKSLAKEGYEIHEAADALEVAEVLMREASSLDLVLLDINIAEVNGQEIFDIISEYSSRIKVIVSSVYPINDQKLRIPKADDYFNKAGQEDALIKKIRNLIGFDAVSG